MTDRPILFSGPMVRAILKGRKTQTRRIVKPAPADVVQLIGADNTPTGEYGLALDPEFTRVLQKTVRCPYGVAGDRLWVREAWRIHERFSDVVRVRYQASERQSWTEQHEDFPVSLAEGLRDKPGYRPSIHMPRWASRITLEITGVRVERLNDCSKADAAAEGLIQLPATGRYVVAKGDQYFGAASLDPREVYAWLWESINGAGSWAKNPWVWVVEFKRAEAAHG